MVKKREVTKKANVKEMRIIEEFFRKHVVDFKSDLDPEDFRPPLLKVPTSMDLIYTDNVSHYGEDYHAELGGHSGRK